MRTNKSKRENAKLLKFVFMCLELKEEVIVNKDSVSIFAWENEHDCYTESGTELTFMCKCGMSHLIEI